MEGIEQIVLLVHYDPSTTRRIKAAYQEGAIELYDRSRYFTVTGQVFNGAPLCKSFRLFKATQFAIEQPAPL